MPIKTILTAVALTLAPSIAAATGCPFGHTEQVTSCKPGTVFDASTGLCIEQPTG